MLAKFTDELLARSFSSRTDKMSVIVLGDDGRYWVVTMAKWSELETQGYEAI